MKRNQILAVILSIFPTILLANDSVQSIIKTATQWPVWGGNYAGMRYSQLDQINRHNINNLQPVWTFSTGIIGGHEGGPLIVNDIIYIHTPFPNTVYAIEQKNHSIIWEYKPTMDADSTIPVMCCDTVSHGLAYADGKIFLQQNNAVLTALDAKTGHRIWSVKNGDPHFGMTNTNAPLVVNNKVMTGISGGEFGVRGFIAAYDIKTGQLAWKEYSTGPDTDVLINPDKTTTWQAGKVRLIGKDSSLNSWKGDQWKIGGGTTWGWYSYDAELNLIYYGSGNPAPWNSVQRPGDNKWTASLWARNADTGEVKWVYQMTPHDEWDFDGIGEVVLVDLEVEGVIQKVAVHFDKNGFAYTLDRKTGALLKANKFDGAVNWESHIDLYSGKPKRDKAFSPEFKGEDKNSDGLCPASIGAKNHQPVSYSPKTRLFYISTNHMCMEYEPYSVKYTVGEPYVGAAVSFRPALVDVVTGKADRETNLGQFTAWDV